MSLSFDDRRWKPNTCGVRDMRVKLVMERRFGFVGHVPPLVSLDISWKDIEIATLIRIYEIVFGIAKQR